MQSPDVKVYRIFASSVTPWNVLNIKLNCRISVKLCLPQEGHGTLWSSIKFLPSAHDPSIRAEPSNSMPFSALPKIFNQLLSARNALMTFFTVHQRIGKSAQMSGCYPCLWIHKIAQSTPHYMGFSCMNFSTMPFLHCSLIRHLSYHNPKCLQSPPLFFFPGYLSALFC